MDFGQLSQFLIASILLTVSPGPDILFVLTTSLRSGFKVGFTLALGLCSGLVVHTFLVGFGIAQMIANNIFLIHIIKVFGVGYLLYLAYLVYMSKTGFELKESKQSPKKILGFYIQGFLMNVLNPKVSLFFLAFLPQFINYELGQIFGQAMILGTVFFIQALIIFTLVSFYASRLLSRFQRNPTIEKLLKYIQIGIFLFLAITILFF